MNEKVFVEFGETWLAVDEVVALEPDRHLMGEGGEMTDWTLVYMSNGKSWTITQPVRAVLDRMAAAANVATNGSYETREQR